MATLNVKDFPDALLRDMKDRAKRAGMTFRGWLILTLQGKQVIVAGSGDIATGQRVERSIRSQAPEPFRDAELDYSECQSEADIPQSEKAKRLADVMSKFPVTKGLR